MIRQGVRLQRGVQLAVGILITVVVMAVVLFQVYWLALNSTRTLAEIFTRVPKFLPTHITFNNYYKLFFTELPMVNFRVLSWNTLVVAVASTILSVIVGTLAALSLSRLRYPGRNVLGISMFFVYLIPPAMLFIPLYLLAARLSLQDTKIGLILAYMSFNVPFCTWMLRGYFQSIPKEMEESAMVDGCTRLGAWMRIVIPLAAPGLVAAALFAFTYAWNEYLYAYVLTESNRARTISIGLNYFITHDVSQWDRLGAGAMVAAAPPVALYLLGQRFVVAGLTAGAVKG